jgi:hypothetical protein
VLMYAQAVHENPADRGIVFAQTDSGHERMLAVRGMLALRYRRGAEGLTARQRDALTRLPHLASA